MKAQRRQTDQWTIGWCASLLLLVALFFTQLSLLPVDSAPPAGGPLRVGFIMVGPVTDCGWNEAHHNGRLFVQAALGRRVETTEAENVPESAEAERVLEKMVSQGNKLIFATSYGYMEPVLRVAARHPDVVFMQVNRPGGTKNVGTYFGSMHEGMYVTGVVAGRMTKTNKLGFVAGHPINQILQEINAYTLGARSVNPKVTVRVIWIGNWYDPPAESEAARALIDGGADVLATIGAYQPVLGTAEHSGVYSVGANGDQHKLLPKSWLTGGAWNWGPLYEKVTESVENHTWHSSSNFYGMKDDCIKLAPFGTAVPKKVQDEAVALAEKIKQGKLVVFKGPLRDRDGLVRLSTGQNVNTDWLGKMNWLVSGVEGTLTKTQ
ncbi:MAG: BMP family ABC transporter substrate-binding protein [Candidatus Melainabacteria bacterium]|nr:MAG: BMP family ABC transporter substrate-binding protein [Candidatus Melainabacteria bacterium]